jgi:hypothetical protein
MAIFAKNDLELLALIMKDFLPITKDAGNYVLTQVQQTINEEVYDAYMPQKYERLGMNGGFIGSWTSEVGANGLNEIDATIFSDPFLMILNEEKFQHGSDWGGDRRAEMSEDIRYGKGYDFGFDMERDFWTPIQDFVDDGSEIDKAFEAGMSKRGIRFIKD